MKKILLSLLLSISFSVVATQPSIKENAKKLLEQSAHVDTVDWYDKGDTSFAENDAFMGVYRHLKASVKNDEINIKMQFVSGPKRPDSNDFSRITSEVCHSVISRIVSPEPSSDKSAAFDFMLNSNLDDYSVFNEKLSKKIDGWDVSIYRIAMLTTCSAKKI